MSSSPWVNISKPKPTNFKDIVNEEINKEPIDTNNLQTDYQLALMLQQEYDDTNNKDYADDSDDGDAEHISECKELQRFDHVVKQRSLNQKTVAVAKAAQSLPRAYRQPIHNEENHLEAEQNLHDYTHVVINGMIKKKLFNSINGVVCIGEKSVILHADSNHGTGNGLAIKVFDIYPSACDSCKKLRIEKAKDPGGWMRYLDLTNCRHKDKTYNKNVHKLAKNEANNLQLHKEAGIASPEVVALKQHVLVMSFIGDDHVPADKLMNIDCHDLIEAYQQVVNAMKNLYEKAKSIHSDLTEDNILWYGGKCYFIDIKQLIELSNENAFQYLMGSCRNIAKYFRRRSPDTLISASLMFFEIVGIDYHDKIALTELQKKSIASL